MGRLFSVLFCPFYCLYFRFMIYFFTPYSFEKKLFRAFDSYMNLVQDPESWICFTDGDTLFLRSDFGYHIEEYIKAYPDTGMFTCIASRCHYNIQRLPGDGDANPSLLYHKEIADKLAAEVHLETELIDKRIAGHLMLIKKSTWTLIRRMLMVTAAGKKILGVDTRISDAILAAGMEIRLMKGIYLLHYLRMKEGYDYKGHLL
jgi:hypothetical protein